MDCYLGIDLGGTNIASGVVSRSGKLLSSVSVPTGAGEPCENIISRMVEAACLASADVGIQLADITAVGVGVPGIVSDNSVVYAPNLGWENVKIGEILSDALGKPVTIKNDASCAAIAEAKFGAAKDFSSALITTLGTGIGGALILNGSLYEGFRGINMEAGHSLHSFDGDECGCGNKGCFEAYAAAPALVKTARRLMDVYPKTVLKSDSISAKDIFTAAQYGDECAMNAVHEYTEHLAAGLCGLVNVLHPEAIVIGGGLSGAGDALLRPLSAAMKKHAFAPNYIPLPKLVCAALGNEAGVIGAAMASCS